MGRLFEYRVTPHGSNFPLSVAFSIVIKLFRYVQTLLEVI
jgi:hypothetical protein